MQEIQKFWEIVFYVCLVSGKYFIFRKVKISFETCYEIMENDFPLSKGINIFSHFFIIFLMTVKWRKIVSQKVDFNIFPANVSEIGSTRSKAFLTDMDSPKKSNLKSDSLKKNLITKQNGYEFRVIWFVYDPFRQIYLNYNNILYYMIYNMFLYILQIYFSKLW